MRMGIEDNVGYRDIRAYGHKDRIESGVMGPEEVQEGYPFAS